MNDSRFHKLADLLINYSCELQKGERSELAELAANIL